MFIKEINVPSVWDKTVSDSFDDDSTYTIVNNSPDIIYAVEGDTMPLESIIGVPVAPGNYIQYEKGDMAYLYLKNGYAVVKNQGVDEQAKTSRVIINKVG